MSAAAVLLAACVWSCLIGTATAAPPNDDFAKARDLAAAPSAVSGNLCGATDQAGQPPRLDTPIWYRFRPRSNAPFNLRITGQGSPSLKLYEGNSLSSLSEVSIDPVVPPTKSQGEEVVAFRKPRAGTTYYVAVDSRGGGCGGGALSLELAPYVTAKQNKNKFTLKFPMEIAPSSAKAVTVSGSLAINVANRDNDIQFALEPVRLTGKDAAHPKLVLRLARKSDCDRALRALSTDTAFVRYANAQGRVKFSGPHGTTNVPWAAAARQLSPSDRGDVRDGAGDC